MAVPYVMGGVVIGFGLGLGIGEMAARSISERLVDPLFCGVIGTICGSLSGAAIHANIDFLTNTSIQTIIRTLFSVANIKSLFPLPIAIISAFIVHKYTNKFIN